MADIEHREVPLGQRHPAHSWEYANAAARNAAVMTLDDPVGGLALQLDDGSYWRLVQRSPIAWAPGPRGEKGEQGDAGDAGEDGTDGVDGDDGLSAYQIAVLGGFSGTITQWLESLRGGGGVPAPGTNGQVLTLAGGQAVWADPSGNLGNPPGVGDPHWANVVLLLNGDDVLPDLSSRDKDASAVVGITSTAVGTHFGTGSLQSAGTNPRIIYPTSPDFRTDGDWTIEFFMTPTENTPGYVCGSSIGQNLRWDAGQLYPTKFGMPATPISMPLNERHHLAISRISTRVVVFRDGVLLSNTLAGVVDEADELAWGLFCYGAVSTSFKGRIEEFRFTQGVGRYNASSTGVLPTGPYVTGPVGEEVASGLPTGGAEGEILGIEGGVPAWIEPPEGGSSLPAGGTDGQVLTLVGGEPAWADPQGGASPLIRATVTVSKGTGVLAIGKAVMFLAIETTHPCRVRLYPTAAERAADSARETDDLTLQGSGLQFEFISINGALGARLGPVVTAANGDDPVANAIYYNIEPTVGSVANVTFTYITLEA